MLKEKVHIAVPTAFHPDESLYIEGTLNHIKKLYQDGIKSVLVSGTTGEQHSLTLREKLELIDALEREEELLDKMEIIFGVASVRQKDVEKLAEAIRDTKIAAIMLGFPPYILPTQKEVISYTKSVINHSKKPIILYNNPGRTGFDLSVKSILELSEDESVIGIKDAGDQEKMKQIQENLNKRNLYYYAGGEVDLEEKVSFGYNRLSSIVGNIAPKEISNWFEHLLVNKPLEKHESVKINKTLEQVYQGNAILNVKKILNEIGTPIGPCRSPIGYRV